MVEANEQQNGFDENTGDVAEQDAGVDKATPQELMCLESVLVKRSLGRSSVRVEEAA